MIMKKRDETYYNVFLSHASTDRATADVVGRKLEDGGLTIFDVADDLGAGPDVADAVREAIWESAALVVIASATYVESPSLLFEVGAAWGAHKPVFLLVGSEGSLALPAFLRKYRVLPLAQVDKLAQELTGLSRPLSDAQRQSLARVYREIGVPSDRLLTDSESASNLTRAFNASAWRNVSEERLLRELLRMRKRGELPRLSKK